MKIKSIYPAGNSSQLREVSDKYSPGELLYAPIDIAKYNHKACVVNFFGDILTPAFEFSNNTHGFKFFISKITEADRNAKSKKIFIGLSIPTHLQAWYTQNSSCACPVSSSACDWMYLRITSSLIPTVDTKYPLP